MVYESTLPDLLAFIMSYYDSLTSGREKKGGGAGAGPPPPKALLMKLSLFWSPKSLPVFPSKTNLRLHNYSVTPKMVKKVIMNLAL